MRTYLKERVFFFMNDRADGFFSGHGSTTSTTAGEAGVDRLTQAYSVEHTGLLGTLGEHHLISSLKSFRGRVRVAMVRNTVGTSRDGLRGAKRASDNVDLDCAKCLYDFLVLADLAVWVLC